MLTQYDKKGFGEEEGMSGSGEQKKLQRTGNSGCLVCAVCTSLQSLAADCCHRNCTCNTFCNPMQGLPHNAVHSSSIMPMMKAASES